MDPATRTLVTQRAGERCEYCLIRQEHYEATLHLEHIVAKQHGGSDDPSNLALACNHCNLHKGPNIAGIDPGSGQVVPLFNPREQLWTAHFELRGSAIVGRTPSGRATVTVLAMNAPYEVDLRADLVSLGQYP
jgi:hypothetical protein